jgi:phosphate transport system substrate-binding protein
MPGRTSAPLAVAVVAAMALVPARATAQTLRLSGTGTGLGAFRLLARAFEQAHPGQAVKLLPSVGSAGAIRAVADGAIEIGISGRPLRPDEGALGVQGLLLARTPFLFAVGPRVAIASITPAELARIYRGASTTWPDGVRIRLVLRPGFDADTLIIRSIAPELDAAMQVALQREGMLVASTNQECNQAVARTPGSIGPSTLTQLLTEPGSPRGLAWNGVAPTVANLENRTYPLEKPILLVIRAAPSPAVRRFVAFLGTAEARRILEQTGNLPVALPPLPATP